MLLYYMYAGNTTRFCYSIWSKLFLWKYRIFILFNFIIYLCCLVMGQGESILEPGDELIVHCGMRDMLTHVLDTQEDQILKPESVTEHTKQCSPNWITDKSMSTYPEQLSSHQFLKEWISKLKIWKNFL